jgi:hypothetical protein
VNQGKKGRRGSMGGKAGRAGRPGKAGRVRGCADLPRLRFKNRVLPVIEVAKPLSHVQTIVDLRERRFCNIQKVSAFLK